MHLPPVRCCGRPCRLRQCSCRPLAFWIWAYTPWGWRSYTAAWLPRCAGRGGSAGTERLCRQWFSPRRSCGALRRLLPDRNLGRRVAFALRLFCLATGRCPTPRRCGCARRGSVFRLSGRAGHKPGRPARSPPISARSSLAPRPPAPVSEHTTSASVPLAAAVCRSHSRRAATPARSMAPQTESCRPSGTSSSALRSEVKVLPVPHAMTSLPRSAFSNPATTWSLASCCCGQGFRAGRSAASASTLTGWSASCSQKSMYLMEWDGLPVVSSALRPSGEVETIQRKANSGCCDPLTNESSSAFVTSLPSALHLHWMATPLAAPLFSRATASMPRSLLVRLGRCFGLSSHSFHRWISAISNSGMVGATWQNSFSNHSPWSVLDRLGSWRSRVTTSPAVSGGVVGSAGPPRLFSSPRSPSSFSSPASPRPRSRLAGLLLAGPVVSSMGEGVASVVWIGCGLAGWC